MMSGGQVLTTYEVDNYAGLPGIGGFDLGMKFREHADKLGVEFAKDTVLKIETADLADENEVLEAAEAGAGHPPVIRQVVGKKETRLAKAVIIASGAHHRKLGIPGEAELTGKGVSYCAICDGSFYRGKKVAVLGGGDTALDDAGYLAGLAEQVYVIHRRKEFRGAVVTVEKLKEKENVTFVLEHQVKEITGKAKVTGVALEDGTVIDVDGVFVAFGSVPQTALVKDLVELDPAGYVKADETGETSLAGLYVAGDVRTKKLRQVVTAVSDGANAATAVAEYVNDTESKG